MKGEYISIETLRMYQEIEKENKKLHEIIEKAKSYVLECEEELLPISPGWIRDLLNILGDSNE
jgi:hypothetical protein